MDCLVLTNRPACAPTHRRFIENMRSAKMKGISRIDSGATHGWFVRAYRDGRTYSKFYSDLKNGSKAKAFKLASAYRDELRDRLGPPSPKPRIMRVNSSNQSGVIGVSLTKRESISGKKTLFYTVSWRPEPNIAQNKSFSVAKWGDKKAFQLAVKFRKDREKEINAKAKK